MIGLLLATLAAATPQPEVMSLDERTGAVLVVVAPTGVRAAGDTSTLLRAADAALRKHTDLRLLSAEQAGADVSQLQRCDRSERLACWVRAVGAEGYLLVLSVGQDRFSAMLIDTARAKELDASTPRSRDGWKEELEDAIFSAAAQSPPEPVRAADDDAVTAYFERLVTTHLRGALESAGRWEALGAIAVDAGAPGFTVQVDGKVVGRAERTAQVEVRDVRPGARNLTVLVPGFEPFTAQVNVEGGKTEAVTATMKKAGGPSLAARPLFWAGGAAVAAGVVLAIAGAAAAGGVEPLCVVREQDTSASCERIGFASFAQDASALPTADPRAYNPGGLLIAPLGFALAGAGAAWLGGALWDPDGEAAPWIVLGAGLLIGGATYGIAAAAGGP